MQGWRKTMEDAHISSLNIAKTDASVPVSIFGVFDGHGGKTHSLLSLVGFEVFTTN